MSFSSNRNVARGATLIEVLVAGALLAVGMAAIASMLNEASFSSRMASRKVEASQWGASLVERMAQQSYAGLTPLVSSTVIYDGGHVMTDAGVELYWATYTVHDISGSVLSVPTYQVDVTVNYWESAAFNWRRPRSQNYAIVVTQP